MKFVVVFFVILKMSVSTAQNDPFQGKKHTQQSKKSGNTMGMPIQVAALGRVADLGDLYDTKTDNFLGISIYTRNQFGNAVHTTKNPCSNIDYVTTESLSEKLEKLGVEAPLSISFLSGFVSVFGSGKYLKDDKKTAESAKASLIYSIRTVRDELKIFTNASRNLIDEFLLTNSDATHVVIGTEWGADTVLSIEESDLKTSYHPKIQDSLEDALKLIARAAADSSNLAFGTLDVENSDTFSIRIHSDVISRTVPQTIDQSVAFIRNIPEIIEKEYNGKGKIMKYILKPIKTVEELLQIESNPVTLVENIEQDLINSFIEIFQEIKDSQLHISAIYNAIKTWNLMLSESEFDKISVVKKQFDTYANDIRQTFADLVTQFRNGNTDSEKLAEWIESYENSNWTDKHITTFLDIFASTVHKIELMELLQSANALFIDRKTDKNKILTNHYNNEIRIISFDLTTDISSLHVRDIILLLEAESAKESNPISYYIEDAIIPTPEVNAYLEGDLILRRKFRIPCLQEYILVKDNTLTDEVIIIDANSYEEIISYHLLELKNSIVAVVDNTFYNIDSLNGKIMSTDLKNIMMPQNLINWTQVGTFPKEAGAVYNGVLVNQSDIYFITYSGKLYSYNTISNTIITHAVTVTSNIYSSLLMMNDIIYIWINTAFFSFDGTTLTQITPPETRQHAAIFQSENTVCRVGGNMTNVDPNSVVCYDPKDGTWSILNYINHHRRGTGLVTTASGRTYLFAGQAWGAPGNPALKTVEMFDPESKIWTYIPSPITDEMSACPQAISFFF